MRSRRLTDLWTWKYNLVALRITTNTVRCLYFPKIDTSNMGIARDERPPQVPLEIILLLGVIFLR